MFTKLSKRGINQYEGIRPNICRWSWRKPGITDNKKGKCRFAGRWKIQNDRFYYVKHGCIGYQARGCFNSIQPKKPYRPSWLRKRMGSGPKTRGVDPLATLDGHQQ